MSKLSQIIVKHSTWRIIRDQFNTVEKGQIYVGISAEDKATFALTGQYPSALPIDISVLPPDLTLKLTLAIKKVEDPR